MPKFPRLHWPAPGPVLQQILLAAPVRLWALILAGPPLTGLVAWTIWIIWRGGWDKARQEQQLDLIGYLAFGLLAIVMVVVVSLAGVKVEAETKLGKLGVGRVDDDDDDDRRPSVAP